MDTAPQVEQFIRENFIYDGPPIPPALSLMEAGILDSTGVLELVAFIEQAFEIKIADDELVPENLDSLASIDAFVGRKKHPAEV